MEITKHLNILYDHLFCNDADWMGKKQYLALFDASTPVAYYLLDLLKAYGIATEFRKFYWGGHSPKRIKFDMDKLYALKEKGITKQRKVSIDEIICRLYDQPTREYSKEHLRYLMIRITGITSNTAINNKILQLKVFGYLKYWNGKYKFTHRLHTHTSHQRVTNDQAYEIVKHSTVAEFFEIIPHKRFFYSLIRLWKQGHLLTLSQLRKSIQRLIDEGFTIPPKKAHSFRGGMNLA